MQDRSLPNVQILCCSFLSLSVSCRDFYFYANFRLPADLPVVHLCPFRFGDHCEYLPLPQYSLPHQEKTEASERPRLDQLQTNETTKGK